jgi:PDZ domain-containing protein
MDPTTYPPPPPAPGPPPPVVTPRRSRRVWVLLIAAAVAFVIGLAAILLPIPLFYVYLPGPLKNVEQLVKVHGARTYSSEGQLYLTTVSVDIHVTFVDWLVAVVDPQRAVVLRSQLTPSGSFKQLERQQRREIEQSKKTAREVAFAELGLGKPTGDGARVVATLPQSPARQFLEPGDVLVAVDSRRVRTTCDVGRAVGRHHPGDRISITVRRNGSKKTVDVTAAKNPQNPAAAFLGVQMKDIDYSFHPGVRARFETGRIVGPSAGLMFTLALYDRLTPDDLTEGRSIAGTGTIECDGDVGPIGGIEEKVAGAETKGAEIFLAPVSESSDAESVADRIKVVPIASFRDAVDYLEGLK